MKVGLEDAGAGKLLQTSGEYCLKLRHVRSITWSLTEVPRHHYKEGRMSQLANGFDASIVDEKALKGGPAGIDIAYQRAGNRDAPLVLLIIGLPDS